MLKVFSRAGDGKYGFSHIMAKIEGMYSKLYLLTDFWLPKTSKMTIFHLFGGFLY